MYPDPKTLTEAEILSTNFELDRTDIYKRFRLLSQMHTAEKKSEQVNGFFVGREYEINSDNLFSLEVQNFKTNLPRYFYSERYFRSGYKSKDIKADFPLLFMTAGERTFTDRRERKRSRFEFDFILFDLMSYDRNNKAGNEVSFRELPEIWRDTETILLEVLEAATSRDCGEIFNLCFAAEYLDLPKDPDEWTPEDSARAAALCKKVLCSGNFLIEISSPLMPFEYKHNKRLAGVHTVIAVEIFTGCTSGTFEKNIC